MTAGSTPLRAIDGSPPEAEPGGAAVASRRLPWVLGLLAAVVLLALAVLHVGAEGRSLGRLPPAERAELYRRTLDTLASVCAGERSRDLRELCRGQAELVLLLPECDAACQATAREQLRTPTR